VGEAVLAYLHSGRPATDAREIFIRTRAPYRKLEKLYSVVRRRLRDAGIKPPGKCGPHIFRHASEVANSLAASCRAQEDGRAIGRFAGEGPRRESAPG
jgi:integrase